MTYETNTVTDRIDAHIKTIAIKALSGEISEESARWDILAALTEAAPWATVARSTPDIDAQLRADLSESLYALIEMKVIEPKLGGFDLRYASRTSACGWARQLSRTAVPSRLRDLRNLGKKSVMVDPLINPTNDMDGATVNKAVTMAFHNHSADIRTAVDELHDLSIETLRESFSEAAAGTRSGRRLHLAARALREAFKLPEPIRPTDFLEREWIRIAIEADEDLARKSAAAFLALTVSVQDDEQVKMDDRLLFVWDDFTSEQLNDLSIKPAAIAHTLMLSAVSGQPKPSRDAIDQTISLIVTATGNDANRTTNREFRPLARQLVTSWAIVECEAVSDFNTKSAGAVNIEKELQRMTDALAWPEISAKIAALPGAPLGNTADAVGAWVASAIGTFSDERERATAEIAADATVAA